MATSTTSPSAILALLSLLLTSSSAAESDVIVPTELATSNNEFSCEIYRRVGSAADRGANVFLSPFSMLIGLGMVHAGARGATRSQLTTAMHLEKYDDAEKTIGEEFHRLISTVNNPSNNHTLRTANRLFAAETEFQVVESFLKFTEDYFGAGLETMDFAREWDDSRREINKWVSDNTENKIEDLLSEGSIDRETVLVIVNAIYFKGIWMNSFPKESTESQTFHLSRTQRTTVDMMTRPVAEFNYHHSADLDCQVLELQYVGNEVSMFVFLPNDTEGLPSVESKLNAGSLAKVFQAMESVPVQVTLPKFQEDQGVELNAYLKQMGMTEMFERTADLSGIDGTRRLRVSSAVHRAYVAVDEEGTEAAAATGYVLKTKSAGTGLPSFVVFTADRPFLYAIVSRPTGCVLFIGRFVAPSSSSRPPGGDGGENGRTAEKRQGGAGSAGVAPGMFLGLWALVLLLTAFSRRLG